MSVHCFTTITPVSPLQNLVRLVLLANFNATYLHVPAIFYDVLVSLIIRDLHQPHINSLHLLHKVYEYARE